MLIKFYCNNPFKSRFVYPVVQEFDFASNTCLQISFELDKGHDVV